MQLGDGLLLLGSLVRNNDVRGVVRLESRVDLTVYALRVRCVKLTDVPPDTEVQTPLKSTNYSKL